MQKLQVLDIRKCPELSSLPKDMDRLISLRELAIEDSPKLSERCEPETDSRLAIKCGGKQLRVDNIVYEADDGGASFNVLNLKKWALSNVGLFSEGQFNTLPQNTDSEVINTTTPSLLDSKTIPWGTRQLKDFDITKKAGGFRRAIRRSFDANVTDNHLEIQLFWAGKGTCCVPVAGSYGPLISALSVTLGKLCDLSETSF
ncbi:hypothetical protein Pint_11498 [Pistacia integerrima]|uniref:Uncharacterized protein n=1 Tax=Pistacia integerrima TaxID=434235 RepID=A0ACC0XI11_9ROSI|nr:hypothetical protein Pint_11498 [Pistacia integerrima]